MPTLHRPHQVPLPIRIVKHAIFSVIPGKTGLRNRACFHHLTKASVSDEFETALTTIQSGDVCIDCGANKGDYTVQLAQAGAKVYAFEPDPWTFEHLSKRVADQNDVHLINKAVSTNTGTIPFFRDAQFSDAPEDFSLASTMYQREDRPQTKISVEMIDFLAFLRDLNSDIAILKMDIEGAEVEILEALLDSDLMSRIRYIFVETHELQFPELLERTWALRARTSEFSETAINLDWH